MASSRNPQQGVPFNQQQQQQMQQQGQSGQQPNMARNMKVKQDLDIFKRSFIVGRIFFIFGIVM